MHGPGLGSIRSLIAALPLILAFFGTPHLAPTARLAQAAAGLPIYAYGDSYTAGWGASSPTAAWPNRLAVRLGRPVIAVAAPNVQLESWAGHLYQRRRTPADTTLILLGLNDERYFGTSAAGLSVVRASLTATVAWSALTGSAILDARAAPSTGPWTPYPRHGAMLATQAGATLRGIAKGDAVYVGYEQLAAPAGGFEVSIDGHPAGTYSCHAPAAPSPSTAAASAVWPAALRIAGLGHGAHTVAISARGDGPVILDWIAGSAGSGPRVVVGTLPDLPARSYRRFAPLDHGSDAATALYNATFTELISTLASGGLDVRMAPTGTALRRPADFAPDGIHPNDSGHLRIASAFQQALDRP